MSRPNREPQMIELDCDRLRALAQRYTPVLRFHERERFYPALAESWLTHVTEAPWTSDPDHHLGDLAPDPHRRGAALYELRRRWELIQPTSVLAVIAGQPRGGDRPLQLSDDEGDPYAIGRRDLRNVDRDTFIGLAGWLDDSMSSGDIDRLYALFSELAAAFNPNDPWLPLEGLADLPHAWIPQPVNPTTYCEARWAREQTDLSDEHGLRDFPPNDGQLNGYLALTYHYLYPAREPGPDGQGYRLEGQWEAATLFFRGEGDHEHGIVADIPEFVVVSRGVDQAGNRHHSSLRPWSAVTSLDGSDHPILYVACGTHRFSFEPQDGTTSGGGGGPGGGGPGAGGSGQPGSDPGSHDDDRHEGGITDLLLLAIILLALAVIAFFLLGWLAAIFFLLLALWAFFEWLASLFDSGDNDDSGTPVPGSEGNDEATDEGTQAGGSAEEPAPADGSGNAGGGSGPGGGGEGGFGLPNTGSPTGRATSFFDVRLVDRVFHDPERHTGYPSDEPCENPTWWDYSGGWGVRIIGGLGTDWHHGTRRVDEHGRSWAYWHGLRLSTFLNGGQPEG